MGQFITDGSAKWDLTFGTLDLELGREFWIGKYVSLSPRMGLRGAWINNDYKVNYKGLFLGTVVDSFSGSLPFDPANFIDYQLPNDAHIHFDNKFKGIGAKFGVDFDFHLTKSFTILANVASSLLYGEFHRKIAIQGGFASDDLGTPLPAILHINALIDDHHHRIRSNIESELGLQWESYLTCLCSRVSLGLSYFFSIWFNQLEFENASAGVSPDPIGSPTFPAANNDPSFQQRDRVDGNLQLHGLVVRFGIAF